VTGGDDVVAEGPLLRPFVDRGPAGATSVPAPPPASTMRDEVRPYLITGGRTTTARTDVAMETVVTRSAAAATGGRVAFELAAVLADCDQPRSVAEVAAHLGIPLVVALILVGDLVEAGLLEASTTIPDQSDDVAFLERLIDGVTAL
jgi:hypothetical protein